MPSNRRLILVTGCPRSGTTAIGDNLALAAGAHFLYEPFNPRFGLRAIERYYEIPGTSDFPLDTFDACVEQVRSLRLNLRRSDYGGDQGWRRIAKRLFGSRIHMSLWRCRLQWGLNTIIWKDPTACFTAQAAVDRHDIPVLVTVRPAIPVAASYKRMSWTSGYMEITGRLAQLGVDFRPIMQQYAAYEKEPAICGALMWRTIYTALLQWAETRPSIRFVSLQDTIERPIESYRGLYAIFGLPWSQTVEDKLRQQYAASDGAKTRSSENLPQRAHVAGRSLTDVNTYGQKLLSAEERALITEITGDLWQRLKQACLSSSELGAAGTRGAKAPGNIAA